MKKVKYATGLVKRTAMAKPHRLDPLSQFSQMEPGIKPVQIDRRVIAEQVAASMAIEDRAVQPEDIIVESTDESRKAVADVLSIRLRDRDSHQPPNDTGAGS